MTDDEVADLRADLNKLADHVRAQGLLRHILSKIDALTRMIDHVISAGEKRD